MNRVLIVYGTKSGCTAGVAEHIGSTLAEHGITADIRPAVDEPDPRGYAAIIVGSGVRAGQWHGSVKKWLTANTESLREIPHALFTTCLTMAAEPEKAAEVRAYTDPLVEQTGIEPVDVGLLAGWNEPKKFSLPERLILKAMKAPEGDFRDWEAVAAWTRSVSGKLGLS